LQLNIVKCNKILNNRYNRGFQPICYQVHQLFLCFFYRNVDASKTMKAMDDILRVYDVGLNSKEELIELITLIVFFCYHSSNNLFFALHFNEKYN